MGIEFFHKCLASRKESGHRTRVWEKREWGEERGETAFRPTFSREDLGWAILAWICSPYSTRKQTHDRKREQEFKQTVFPGWCLFPLLQTLL